MTDLGDLAFHVQYHLREISCAQLLHDPCQAVHREHTGEATLTLAGPAQLIREAAAAVFPDLAKVFNPPPAEPALLATCATCGAEYTSMKPGDDRCRQCTRERWTPVGGNNRNPMLDT
jgi:hypothetical protein